MWIYFDFIKNTFYGCLFIFEMNNEIFDVFAKKNTSSIKNATIFMNMHYVNTYLEYLLKYFIETYLETKLYINQKTLRKFIWK